MRKVEQDAANTLAATFDRLHDQVDEYALEEACEDGDYRRMERILGLDPGGSAYRILLAGIVASIFGLFNSTADEELDDYNPLDPTARDRLNSLATAQAVALLAGARLTMAGIITRSRGQDAATIARRLHDWVWLSDREAARLSALEDTQDEDGAKTTRSVIDRQTDRKMSTRIMGLAVILVTAVIAIAFLWALWISGYRRKVRWVTARDERVCPRCGPMDGETIDLGSVFSNGLAYPPVHDHCRCGLERAE